MILPLSWHSLFSIVTCFIAYLLCRPISSTGSRAVLTVFATCPWGSISEQNLSKYLLNNYACQTGYFFQSFLMKLGLLYTKRKWHSLSSRWRRDFPGSPVVMTRPFQFREVGSIPGGGTNIPHAMLQVAAKKKKKRGQAGRRIIINVIGE